MGCGGEGGIRTHEHPLRCYWNSSPAPSTARPPLQSITYDGFGEDPRHVLSRGERRRMISHAGAAAHPPAATRHRRSRRGRGVALMAPGPPGRAPTGLEPASGLRRARALLHLERGWLVEAGLLAAA